MKTAYSATHLLFPLLLKNGMKCLFFIVCCGVVFLQPLRGLPASGHGGEGPKTFEDYEQRRRVMATRMEMATVWVIVEGHDGSSGMGTGFIVGDGYILTNAHVASKEETKHIYIANEALPPTEAYIVASTPEQDRPNIDFSLLRFEVPTGVKLPVLVFNNDVRRMDRVSVWGYPYIVLQFDKSLNDDEPDFSVPPVVYTEGAVNAIVYNARPTIIHSAAIAAGNSGGPLVNRNGEVVGINTWGSTEEDEGAFINASLPTSLILPFLKANGVLALVASLEQPNSYEALPVQPEMHREKPQKPSSVQPGSQRTGSMHIGGVVQAIGSAGASVQPEARRQGPVQTKPLPIGSAQTSGLPIGSAQTSGLPIGSAQTSGLPIGSAQTSGLPIGSAHIGDVRKVVQEVSSSVSGHNGDAVSP